MTKVKNKRKHTRYAWQGIVTYRRSSPNRAIPLKEISGKGQLQNVSRGGLGLLTHQRLTPKEFLMIRFPLVRPELAIPSLAYVRWSRPVRGTGRYAAGLRFLA
jgi:PilZ domain